MNFSSRVVAVKTKYLAEHPRADPAIALKSVCVKIGKLKASKWLTATQDNRTICVEKCDVARSQEALLDGCYVVKSDIPKPTKLGQKLLDAANIILPSVLPKIAASVHTKKKLDSERKQRNYK